VCARARTHTLAHKHTYTFKDAQEIIKKKEEEKAEAAARMRNFIERGGRKTFPSLSFSRFFRFLLDALSPTTTFSTNYTNSFINIFLVF
jgi:hypothetical protein